MTQHFTALIELNLVAANWAEGHAGLAFTEKRMHTYLKKLETCCSSKALRNGPNAKPVLDIATGGRRIDLEVKQKVINTYSRWKISD